MAEINRAGEVDSLGQLDTTQGVFRQQIDALTDAVRQLGGKAEIAPGASVINDPLNAPFILFVDAYIGDDTFVTGDYATKDDNDFNSKIRRIQNQRLECGYTASRPFKTLNRAVIEAAIITSRDFLNLNPAPCGDLVTIVVQSGEHVVLNGPGLADATGNFPEWTDGMVPTAAQLQSFNPQGGSGIILPRGVSVVSLDLRKTRLTPDYVPAPADEAEDLSNRAALLRVSGGGFFYGFTFSDKTGLNQSHHLLSCFEFAGQALLNEFYSKIRKALSGPASLNDDYAVARNEEAQITAPVPLPGTQTSATDTTEGSSPYIYNCSIRSDYGLCGILANGELVTGLKSFVIAQYTGVSLQKDLSCWQKYNSGGWGAFADYTDYINEAPDNTRMKPQRRSFHIRAINRAIIQEVSVFAIGQGIHHWVQSGGELTVTNSNSNFGGCASLAEGALTTAFQTDENWNVASINVARGMDGLENKFKLFEIGELVENQSNTSKTLTLTADLEGALDNEPDVIGDFGYTLNNYGGTSYLWINNANGLDYYAPLSDTAWDPVNPNKLVVDSAFLSADGGRPPSTDTSSNFPPLAGNKVYIRRLQDIRSLDERSYTLTCKNTSSNSRNIVRDYNVQTDTSGTSINTNISDNEPLIATNIETLKTNEAGVFRVNKIGLRRGAASAAWDSQGEYRTGYHLSNNYYRQGDVVRYQNKHWKCIEEHIAPVGFDSTKWDQSFVHMQDDYAAEDFFKNIRPLIIFDKDKDNTLSDGLLGYTNADWGSDAELERQLHTGTDYLGVYSFLRSLGFNDADSHQIMLPQPVADRERNPTTALDGIANPAAAANTWANWPLEMRRPSQIRLFGHAMEWSGTLNYTKALPKYQKDLTASNKFSYYFTNELGGRVYISAFNEEGFQVTAAGLTDLATGETISAEGLGDAGAPNDVTVINGKVVINGELEANRIESAQRSKVYLSSDADGPNKDKPSEGRGMSWMAPAKAIPGVSDNEAATFDTQNENGSIAGITGLGALGFSGPNFITPAWLELWKGQNQLLGSVSGPILIFVNPKAKAKTGNFPNAAANESYNYNANLNTLFSRPPTSADSAVRSLALAIQFADLYVSTTTPVYYYLGPGIYQNGGDAAGSFTFRHPVQLMGYNYANNQLTTDGNGGGAYPFMGTTNGGRGVSNSGKVTESDMKATFKDTNRAPIFITRTYHSAVNRSTQNLIGFDPTTFTFKQDATIQGIVIWGATDTLESLQGSSAASDNLVNNSLYTSDVSSLSKLNSIKGEARDKILNAFVYEAMAEKSNDNDIDYLTSQSVFSFYKQLRVRDVAIGAVGLPYYNSGASEDQSVFRTIDNGYLRLNGTYFIGNNLLDNTGYASQGETVTPRFRGQTTYNHAGFAPTLYSSSVSSSNAIATFQFCGWGTPKILGASNYVWNTTYINNHLITSNFEYMDVEDTVNGGTATTEFMQQGPAFRQFIGNVARNRRMARSSYNDYRTPNNAARSGWAGFFGRYQETWSTTVGAKTGWQMMGCSAISKEASSTTNTATSSGPNSSISSGTSWDYDDRGYTLRRNQTTGTTPSGIAFPASPAILSTNHAYAGSNSDLNIKYSAVKPGIDWEGNYSSNRSLYG